MINISNKLHSKVCRQLWTEIRIKVDRRNWEFNDRIFTELHIQLINFPKWLI